MSTINQFLLIIIVSGALATAGSIFITSQFQSSSFLAWNYIDNLIFKSEVETKNISQKFGEYISSEISSGTTLGEYYSISEKSLATKPISKVTADKEFLLSKTKIIASIPFTTQAPLGEWDDPRQKYGCEEALMVMVWHWITESPLDPILARMKILNLVTWQDHNYGNFLDTSTHDTALRFQKYFGHQNVEVAQNVSLGDIKNAIDNNKIVLIPTNGQTLGNPYFKPPGPIHHMFMIKGYDDDKKEFIANDPGTLYGENIRYTYQNIDQSLRDYPTGLNEPIVEYNRLAIFISKH